MNKTEFVVKKKIRVICILLLLGLVMICIGTLAILENHCLSISSLLCLPPPMKYVTLSHFSILEILLIP